MRRLFIGGLNWETDDAGLRAAFEVHGRIEDVKVISDRETGRSRGFGFVTFQSPLDAEKARQKMDGAELEGRRIRVDIAEDRRGGGGSGGPSKTDRFEPEVIQRPRDAGGQRVPVVTRTGRR